MIREELRAHDPALLDKPMLVAFNKIDLPAAAEAWPAFRQRASCARRLDVVADLRRGRGGHGPVPRRARRALARRRRARASRPSLPAWSSIASTRCRDGFAVERDDDGAFRVRGTRIERLAAQTNFDVEESAERFQRDLARLGIDAELRRAGMPAGDTVRIGAVELEWEAQPWERA